MRWLEPCALLLLEFCSRRLASVPVSVRCVFWWCEIALRCRFPGFSSGGISLKTQELYALVFTTRYLDIFVTYISLYNTVMKLIFLGTSFSIVWYMRYHKTVRLSYDRSNDTFRHYFLILVPNNKFTFREVLWTFSLYLEAVAIIPQLVLLQRTRNIDNLTGNYVFFLGLNARFQE